MKKLLFIIWISIGGWIGWWLGDYIGTMTAFFFSVVGAAAGLYFGKKIMTYFVE